MSPQPILTPYKPPIGDIACFDGGQFGHLAIIIDINSDGTTVAQQNFFNDKRDLSTTITNNTITDDYGNLYTLKGYLRPHL
jgi:surface antigen